MRVKTRLLLLILIANSIIWFNILFPDVKQYPEIYFLDVGQGDSEMIVMPNNVKVLIDGGPNNKVLDNLAKIFYSTDRYIDIVALTHAQLDHYGGLIEVLKRYKVGTFVYNGADGESQGFRQLKKIAKEKNVPIVVLGEGDRIKYLKNRINVLSPSKEFLSAKELNDTTLVLRYEGGGMSALFTGDIGKKVENYLTDKYNLKTDILKIPHHGSKNSSAEKFIKEAAPKISIIEVGKNSYGHPTKQVLDRLANVGTQVFRTDRDGMVKIVLESAKLNIFKEK